MRKSLRVQVRINEELRARLDNVEQIAKIKESVFFAELLEAYCDYVEANAEISFPLTVIPKKKLAALHEQLESNPPPTAKKGRGGSHMLGRIAAKTSGC
ncbi:MAG: hypothetical protein LBK60_03880 [Verrucomicrobiales bacterium]|nr:hypothetical protein [Verrucomicrobiales bacterium]